MTSKDSKKRGRDEKSSSWIPLNNPTITPPKNPDRAIEVVKVMFDKLKIERADWLKVLSVFISSEKTALYQPQSMLNKLLSILNELESAKNTQSMIPGPQSAMDQPPTVIPEFSQGSELEETRMKVQLAGRAQEVYTFLTDGASFPCSYISAYKLLKGFPINGCVQFFHNPLILEEYFKGLHTGNQIEFEGPISIGKSYNLALFKLLLAANYKEYRVIYIHNIADWLSNPPEILDEWLETQLVYTFMEELQDEENIQAFKNFFQDSQGPYLQLRKLFEDIFPPGNKATVFLIDQFNVWRKPLQEIGVTYENAHYKDSSAIINIYITQMKNLAQCKMNVSSMTAERENRNTDRIYINETLPESTLDDYIRFTLGTRVEPYIKEIKKWTNGNPGEIMKIQDISTEDIEEKISKYCEKRIISISNDFKDFLNKKNQDPRCKTEDLIYLFQMLTIYIDLPPPYSLPLEVKPLSYMYDGRYIKIDGMKHATSVLPLVKYALRRDYFLFNKTRDELANIIMGNPDASVYGKLLEDYLIKALDNEKNFEIKLTKIDSEKELGLDSIQLTNTLQEFSDMQLLAITPYETRIYRPHIFTFPGLDFILVTPYHWYFVQAKSVLDTTVLTKFDEFSQDKVQKSVHPRIYKTRQALKDLVNRTEKESKTKRHVIWVMLYLQIDSQSVGKFKDSQSFLFWSAFDLPDHLQIKVSKIRSK